MSSVPVSNKKSTSVGVYARAIFQSLPSRGEKWSLRPTLFDLARRLKDVSREIDAATLDAIADDWHARMGAAMVETDVCEVRALLKNGYEKARYGRDEPTLKSEYRKVQAEPLSEIAKRFRNPGLRDTVRACESAQGLNPNGDFAMPQERLGELIGRSQVQAGRYLNSLCEAGVIEVTAKAVPKKLATRYRFVKKAVVIAMAQTVLGRVWKLLGTLSKLVTGKATGETESPTDDAGVQSDESGLPDFLRSDFEFMPYDPTAYMPSSGTGARRDRDGPRKPKPRKSVWEPLPFKQLLFEESKPKGPAPFTEPDIV